MTGGDPGITVNLFYIAVEQETHLQMGSGEILFRDKRFHQTMRAMAAFDIDFRVRDPRLFLTKIVGMHARLFHMEDVEPKLQSLLCGLLVEEMSRRFAHTALGELNSNLSAVSFALLPSASTSFAAYGLELVRLQLRHIHVNTDDLNHLQELERLDAEGRMKTDLEAYNLASIYHGDVNERTRAEVLTGMPRGPYPPGTAAPLASSLGAMAAGLAYLRSLPEETWRPFVESMAGNAGRAGEAGRQTNDADNNLPPIRRNE